MPTSNLPVDESSFFHCIASGADLITPRQARRLVSDLPDVRGDFARPRDPS